MSYISDKNWSKYKKVINKASETFNQLTVIWKKSRGGIDRHGEDNLTERFDDIPLKCLANYNDRRVWPINVFTESGELDEMSEVLMFNMAHLKEKGFVNDKGNFIFEPSTDRIIHKGIKWKCAGMTDLSQAADEPLHVHLILQKDPIPTNNPTH